MADRPSSETLVRAGETADNILFSRKPCGYCVALTVSTRWHLRASRAQIDLAKTANMQFTYAYAAPEVLKALTAGGNPHEIFTPK
jgi:hypothetical protein